jgi:uncharacterized SAM-binding protein YcdF (DUF218 family)
MIYLHKLLPALLLPIGLTLTLAAAGVLLRRRWLIGSGLAVLWLASTPLVSDAAIRAAEGWQVRQPAALAPAAQAIVVLGGAYVRPPGDPAASEWNEAVDRLYGGVDLYQAGKAPLLVFTAAWLPWQPDVVPEGAVLAEHAVKLGVPRDHIRITSRVMNTDDEARAVAELLSAGGDGGGRKAKPKVLLVTSAYHMRRAQQLFEQAGLEAFPFPVDFQVSEGRQRSVLDFIPSAAGLWRTETALRELYGWLFYWVIGPLSH